MIYCIGFFIYKIFNWFKPTKHDPNRYTTDRVGFRFYILGQPDLGTPVILHMHILDKKI